MPTREEIFWYELRLVIIVYLCLNIGYTFFLSSAYGQEPSQDWPSLLQDLTDALKKGKEGRVNISIITIYVVLTTLPLVISSFLSAIVLHRQGGPILFLAAVVIPFMAYFYLIDRSALHQVLDAAGDSRYDLSAYAKRLTSEIFNFYLLKYKFPLTVGSIILGCWAGYRYSTWKDLR
jgi:hypothetical protein